LYLERNGALNSGNKNMPANVTANYYRIGDKNLQIGNFVSLDKIYDMSTKELKEEINKVLNDAPDELLESVLDYLKGLLSSSKSNAIISSNLNRILHEDKELLERLAK
jgi:hypothetical protein